ncbi:MAG: cysteine--tRNA ligase [Patescibacteria group bacterium]
MMSEIKFYNTLTRRKETFKPLGSDFVRVYDCGPTVYMRAHIGNMWRYIVSDLVRRVLEYNNYDVKQVMNITDVGHLTEEDLAADTGEDKVEKTAREKGKTPQEIADFYTEQFLQDLDLLNIQKPHVLPHATDYVPKMIKFIKRLEDKGFTYRAGKYLCFDISKFSDYGKLSGKRIEELKSGARLEPVPGKKNPFDFALWIADENHVQKWDSPWGVGYPGWHIECSTMVVENLGEQIDIHSGGEDNIFPHHENEIAQSEAATGKQFVQYWIHIRHNVVNGRKMSKSLGNFFVLDDILERGYDPLAYRYLCLLSHYRSQLNFTWGGLDSAAAALRNLRRYVRTWDPATTIIDSYKECFVEAVNNDLNLPQALGVTWDMVRSGYSSGEKKATLMDFDRVLGFQLSELEFLEIPSKVQALVEQREEAREEGDFEGADKLRDKIREHGFEVDDTEAGSQVYPRE